MLLTLCWFSAAVLAPAIRAKYSMRKGLAAFSRKNYEVARLHLERAARFAEFRERAVELLAEASIYAGRPADALYALNTMLLEQPAAAPPRRVKLLRGVAGCMIGRPAAARRELGSIPREGESVEELLATMQACLLAGDLAGAKQLYESLEKYEYHGAVAARVRLCRAALLYREGAWKEAFEALPADADCSPQDAPICQRVKKELAGKLQEPALKEQA